MEHTAYFSPTQTEKNKFLGRTYGFMALALVLSAVSAFLGATTPFILSIIWGNRYGFVILCAIEIALVFVLSIRIRKMSLFSAGIMFFLYAIINGLTLSSIFYIFDIKSISYSFLASAIMFGGMSIYGLKTKSNLASVGKFLGMALLGIILVSSANLLITVITKHPLAMVEWIVSIATVVIFTGLTAWDSQKIMRTAERAQNSNDYKKVAILGALELYLDFINIFLSLLRIFGRSRD